MADQTIRVSARGEFGQLQRGLKQLQGDLKNVIGEIDKGARKGGFFDESQIRALDFFKRRFTDAFRAMNDELQKQDTILKTMYDNMKRASGEQQRQLQKELDKRSEIVENLRDQVHEMERIHRLHSSQASSFKTGPSGSGSSAHASGGGSSASSGGAGARLGQTLFGGAKFLLGMAGLGGIATLASQAYSMGHAKSVDTLDLAQRLRSGRGPYREANNEDMYDRVGRIGLPMGYGKMESWQFMDSLSRQAGYVGDDTQKHLMTFGRAYGLQSSEVAGLAGANFQSGGGSMGAFTDAIAGSVAKSGMTPRIEEVMETNNALLKEMNTTLKDGSSRQILAYQTTLDQIGTANGMTRLTGAAGANVIGGLGGIFKPGNDQWKWMGIKALQSYNPQKYGNMDLFDLEQSFEDGLTNFDNVPAMAQYVNGQTGGNEKLNKRILQKWLTDGGFASTKREASEFYDATNGLTSFSPDQMEALKNGSIDSGAKYGERAGLRGQEYQNTDANFDAELEAIGSKVVTPVVQEIKGLITDGLGALNKGLDKLKELMGNSDGKGGFGDFFSKASGFFKDIADGITGLSKWFSEHWGDITSISGILKGIGNVAADIANKGKKFASYMIDDVTNLITPKPEDVKSGKWYVRLLEQMLPGFKGTNDKLDKGEAAKPGRSQFMKILEELIPGLKESNDSLDKLGTEGQKKIDTLQKDGNKSIDKLQKDGSQSFGDIYSTVEEKMTDIQKAHTGLIESLKSHLFEFFPSVRSQGNFGNSLDLATKVIANSESGDNYDTVVKDDNGAMSIGKLQWHGSRAAQLLRTIAQKNPEAVKGILGENSQLYKDIMGNDSLSNRKLSNDEAQRVQTLLSTSDAQGIEDTLAKQDVGSYLSTGQGLGISDPKALAYFADLYNQSPNSAIDIAKGSPNKTLIELYQGSLKNSVLGKYKSRRNQAYEQIVGSSLTGSGVTPIDTQATAATEQKLTVEFKVSGDGANVLNQSTYDQLRTLVAQIVKEQSAQSLSVVPSTRG